MTCKLITSSRTELDIENAICWYLDIERELARSFLLELRAAIKYIQSNPEKTQIRYQSVRIAFLKKFPFGIHYKFEKDTITILGVFHTSQNPAKWEKRQ